MRLYFLFALLMLACHTRQDRTAVEHNTEENPLEEARDVEEMSEPAPEIHYADSDFVNLALLSADFVFNLKYASDDNFLGERVYSCGECFLRYEVASALVEANSKFLEKGYRIKLYDCYRPLRVQRKMWAMVPDARYVANPYTSVGSYHNRGSAVDITLVDESGHELDMGTAFDFFGEESHYAYPGVSDAVRFNRDLLREVMESVGFKGIRTEWWHFSRNSFPVSDRNFCPEP